MAKVSNAIMAKGTVVKQTSAHTFLVELDATGGKDIMEYEECRRLRKRKGQKIEVGDSVSLELNRNDLSDGQIIYA